MLHGISAVWDTAGHARKEVAVSIKPRKRLRLEIGEEFRHILYHIKAPKFYRYLDDEIS